MVVALTVTPALCLLLLAQGAARGAASRRSCAWLQRGYTARARRGSSARRAVVSSATAATLVAGVAVLPFLGESLFPTFKERDFLMHWVTRPGTGHQEIVRITERASRDLRAIPGVRNFGAHIGRAVHGEEIDGINFAENWISVDPNADYDKTLDADRGRRSTAYPGLFRDADDLPERAHRRGAGGVERGDRRAHLRPRPERAARQGRRGARRP